MKTTMVLPALLMSCLAFVACTPAQFDSVLTKPAHGANLRSKIETKGYKNNKATGHAIRTDDGNWAIRVQISGLDAASVKNIALMEEPYVPSVAGMDGNCVVSWEVPKDRWLDKKPFALSIALGGDNSEMTLAVRHTASETDLTFLGYVVVAPLAAVYLALSLYYGIWW